LLYYFGGLEKKTKAYSVEETLCSTPYFPIKKGIIFLEEKKICCGLG
jgi:hypothetical protein